MKYDLTISRAASSPVPSTRKDAARNRARLLRVADELISAGGLDVTLADVARGAGVGVGTVYRHFPTKADLVGALFDEEIDDAVEGARRAAADPDGWRGLVLYLTDTTEAQARNRGLRALLCPSGPTNPADGPYRTKIDPLVQQMVDKAHEQGTLRSDFDTEDIAYIQVALVAIMDASIEAFPTLYRRHLQLFLDGLRTKSTPS